MTAKDKLFALFLLALDVWIWVRDLSWTDQASDALPILVALPLFVFLVMPWRWKIEPFHLDTRWFALGIFLSLPGWAFGLTTLLVSGWGALAWSWLSVRLDENTLHAAKRLAPLCLLAAPWIALDGAAIGWGFRLSGAIVTEWVYSLIGFTVERQGTMLSIQGAPISVEAACAGMNTLQAMLIAGVALAYIVLGKSHLYWRNVILLPIFAWAANTIRILLLSGLALSFSPEFVMGTVHDFSGWLVIVIMFLICQWIFLAQLKWNKKNHES